MFNKTKIYYFAYGSNLSLRQMLTRCPHAKFIAKAKIKNYQFGITGYSARWRGGGATILPKKGTEVWGVVYEVDSHCLSRLDGFERLRQKAYSRKSITCHFANGRTKRAMVYIREPRRLTHSSHKYRSTILKGALSANLPASYMADLRLCLR